MKKLILGTMVALTAMAGAATAGSLRINNNAWIILNVKAGEHHLIKAIDRISLNDWRQWYSDEHDYLYFTAGWGSDDVLKLEVPKGDVHKVYNVEGTLFGYNFIPVYPQPPIVPEVDIEVPLTPLEPSTPKVPDVDYDIIIDSPTELPWDK